MKRYQFTVTLVGHGKTPDEGWKDALKDIQENPFDYTPEPDCEDESDIEGS